MNSPPNTAATTTTTSTTTTSTKPGEIFYPSQSTANFQPVIDDYANSIYNGASSSNILASSSSSSLVGGNSGADANFIVGV